AYGLEVAIRAHLRDAQAGSDLVARTLDVEGAAFLQYPEHLDAVTLGHQGHRLPSGPDRGVDHLSKELLDVEADYLFGCGFLVGRQQAGQDRLCVLYGGEINVDAQGRDHAASTIPVVDR